MKQIFEFNEEDLAAGMLEYVRPNLKTGKYKPSFSIIKDTNSRNGVKLQLTVESVDTDEPTDV